MNVDPRIPAAAGRDPMLTQIGVAQAIRGMAELADGRTDPDQQLQWALDLGFLARKPGEREVVCLTERGAAVVYAFWKAYEEGREEQRKAIQIYLPGEAA